MVAVWQALGSMLDIRVASSIGFFNLFKSLWFAQLSSQLRALWRVGIIAVIHNLWYARNQVVFYDKSTSISMIIRAICNNIKEAESFKVGHMKNSISDLAILRRLHVSGLPQKAAVMVSVSWLKPPFGWIKINTDGAARGAPGIAGAGGIFRDHRGIAIASFAAPLEVCYAFEAELQAVIIAIK